MDLLYLPGQLVDGGRSEHGGKLDEVTVRIGWKAVQTMHRRRSADENAGTLPFLRRFGQCCADLAEVVAVEVGHMPTEGGPLVRDGLDRGDAVDRPVDLGVVATEE